MSSFITKLLVVFGLNLLLFLILFVIAGISNSLDTLVYLFFTGVGILILELLVGTILAISTKHRRWGEALMASSLLIGLIGFSFCNSL